MTYEKIKNLTAEGGDGSPVFSKRRGRVTSEKFKRLCGDKKETFAQMVELVKNHEKIKTKTGRPSKLSLENQVLMTLEY